MDTKRSAVLLDIENLLFAGTHDKSITANLVDLTKQIVEFVEKTEFETDPDCFSHALDHSNHQKIDDSPHSFLSAKQTAFP